MYRYRKIDKSVLVLPFIGSIIYKSQQNIIPKMYFYYIHVRSRHRRSTFPAIFQPIFSSMEIITQLEISRYVPKVPKYPNYLF